jgi:hypothetical protein
MFANVVGTPDLERKIGRDLMRSRLQRSLVVQCCTARADTELCVEWRWRAVSCHEHVSHVPARFRMGWNSGIHVGGLAWC